jgi:hypothetical protein
LIKEFGEKYTRFTHRMFHNSLQKRGERETKIIISSMAVSVCQCGDIIFIHPPQDKGAV